MTTATLTEAMRLTDGRTLPVPHPERVGVAGLTIFVADPKQDGSYKLVDVMQIVSLGFEAVPASPGSNGGQ